MLCQGAKGDEIAWGPPNWVKLYKTLLKVHWMKWGLDQLEERSVMTSSSFFWKILCFWMSFLCLDFPTSLDLACLRDLLLRAPTVVDEDFGLSGVGSKAECHELVSSEHTEEGLKWSMAGSEVEHKLLACRRQITSKSRKRKLLLHEGSFCRDNSTSLYRAPNDQETKVWY